MEQEMNYGSDYKPLPTTSIASGVGIEVLPDLYCHTVQIVNIHLVGDPKSGEFVLVDAGMPDSSEEIFFSGGRTIWRKRQAESDYFDTRAL